MFGIVAAEVIVLVGRVEARRGGGAEGCAHFGEEVEDVLGCDGLSRSGGGGGGGRHCGGGRNVEGGQGRRAVS